MVKEGMQSKNRKSFGMKPKGVINKRGKGSKKGDDSKPNTSISKRIRDTRRLLAKPDLDDALRTAQEKRLEDLLKESDKHRKQNLERKYAAIYHKVRFFERVKLERQLKKLKALGTATTPEQKSELKRIEDDLQYVLNFPKGERYVSLLVDAEDPDAQAHLESERARLRALIHKEMAEDALVTEADEGRSLRNNAVAAGHAHARVESKKGGKDRGAGYSDDDVKQKMAKKKKKEGAVSDINNNSINNNMSDAKEEDEEQNEEEDDDDDFFLASDDDCDASDDEDGNARAFVPSTNKKEQDEEAVRGVGTKIISKKQHHSSSSVHSTHQNKKTIGSIGNKKDKRPPLLPTSPPSPFNRDKKTFQKKQERHSLHMTRVPPANKNKKVASTVPGKPKSIPKKSKKEEQAPLRTRAAGGRKRRSKGSKK